MRPLLVAGYDVKSFVSTSMLFVSSLSSFTLFSLSNCCIIWHIYSCACLWLFKDQITTVDCLLLQWTLLATSHPVTSQFSHSNDVAEYSGTQAHL